MLNDQDHIYLIHPQQPPTPTPTPPKKKKMVKQVAWEFKIMNFFPIQHDLI